MSPPAASPAPCAQRRGHSMAQPTPLRPIAGSKATRVRFQVVALATTLAMVTYIDRVCISTLQTDIRRDLSLSIVQMGYAFSAFAMAYAAFEIPTAWWADRLGTR